MRYNQKGYIEIVAIAIILGMIGSIFILGIFVWKEIEKQKLLVEINSLTKQINNISFSQDEVKEIFGPFLNTEYDKDLSLEDAYRLVFPYAKIWASDAKLVYYKTNVPTIMTPFKLNRYVFVSNSKAKELHISYNEPIDSEIDINEIYNIEKITKKFDVIEKDYRLGSYGGEYLDANGLVSSEAIIDFSKNIDWIDFTNEGIKSGNMEKCDLNLMTDKNKYQYWFLDCVYYNDLYEKDFHFQMTYDATDGDLIKKVNDKEGEIFDRDDLDYLGSGYYEYDRSILYRGLKYQRLENNNNKYQQVPFGHTEIINNVDFDSFEVLGENCIGQVCVGLAKDKNNVYSGKYLLSGIADLDVASFELVNKSSMKDINNNYIFTNSFEIEKR